MVLTYKLRYGGYVDGSSHSMANSPITDQCHGDMIFMMGNLLEICRLNMGPQCALPYPSLVFPLWYTLLPLQIQHKFLDSEEGQEDGILCLVWESPAMCHVVFRKDNIRHLSSTSVRQSVKGLKLVRRL